MADVFIRPSPIHAKTTVGIAVPVPPAVVVASGISPKVVIGPPVRTTLTYTSVVLQPPRSELAWHPQHAFHIEDPLSVLILYVSVAGVCATTKTVGEVALVLWKRGNEAT